MMRRLPTFALLAALASATLAVSAAGARKPEPEPARVTANGFTLTSSAIELPVDEPFFPDSPDGGPKADTINADCTACHSASMTLTQPALSPEAWAGVVHKMRDVYHAPVPEEDVPAILAYLAHLSPKAAPVRE
ncbi:cytochrome c [Novosphingobium sp.]|uniref:cytochrome c n=1 Tax=Novosphingobium sp. TaxID=1874826 RepID=UPI00352B2939